MMRRFSVICTAVGKFACAERLQVYSSNASVPAGVVSVYRSVGGRTTADQSIESRQHACKFRSQDTSHTQDNVLLNEQSHQAHTNIFMYRGRQ